MDENKLKLSDIFSFRTTSSPEKAKKVAKSIALLIGGIILVGVVLLLVIKYNGYEANLHANRPDLSLNIFDPDRILVLVIAFMIYRISRMGAVLGAIYYLASFILGAVFLFLKMPGGGIQITLLIFGFLTLRACQASFNYHTLRHAKTIWRNVIVKTVASIVYGSLLSALTIYLIREGIIVIENLNDELLGNMILGACLIGIILSFCGWLPFTRKRPLCDFNHMPLAEPKKEEE